MCEDKFLHLHEAVGFNAHSGHTFGNNNVVISACKHKHVHFVHPGAEATGWGVLRASADRSEEEWGFAEVPLVLCLRGS